MGDEYVAHVLTPVDIRVVGAQGVWTNIKNGELGEPLETRRYAVGIPKQPALSITIASF